MAEQNGAPKARLCGDVVLIMWGNYGHVFPFLQLARRIIQQGLTCTMLMEEEARQRLEQDLKKMSSEERQCLDIEWLQTKPGFPPGGLKEKLDLWEQAGSLFFNKVEKSRSAGATAPACIVGEMFSAWTQKWATRLNIPRYVFVTSPGMFAYWMSKYSDLIRDDHLLDREEEDPVLDLPGAPKLRLSESPFNAIPGALFYAGNGDTFHKAAGILIHTFYDLEASIIDGFNSYLRDRPGDGGEAKGAPRPRARPIGPLALKMFQSSNVGQTEPTAKSPCIGWLDSRPPASVVYLAFGSARMFDMPRVQMHELAKALANTGVSFLWLLVPPPDESDNAVELVDYLPSGFLERTKNQGLVYSKFAPQLDILAHPATAIFVTHCGWNSALESLSKGVPFIGWPRHAEQQMCMRILQAARVLVPITESIRAIDWLIDAEKALIPSLEIEKCMRTTFMDGATMGRLKTQALELQRLLAEAVAPGGSSYQNMDNFVEEIRPKG